MTTSRPQALALAAALHTPLASVERHRIPDTESRLRWPPLRPDPLLVLRGLHQPHHKLGELLIVLLAAWPAGCTPNLAGQPLAGLYAAGHGLYTRRTLV